MDAKPGVTTGNAKDRVVKSDKETYKHDNPYNGRYVRYAPRRVYQVFRSYFRYVDDRLASHNGRYTGRKNGRSCPPHGKHEATEAECKKTAYDGDPFDTPVWCRDMGERDASWEVP